MFSTFQPVDCVDEPEQQRGLRALLYDGMCSQVMGVFTGGAFLVGFAVLLGASNTVIGLFAAVGPFTQILQIPSIFLVERVRMRKAMVVISSLAGRVVWLFVAALPWVAPAPARIPLLVLSMVMFFGLGSISGCAFNSWMRDFIPEKIMGSYFARRMAISIALGAILSLIAGVGIDIAKTWFGAEMFGYSILFLVGGAFGLAGAGFLARIPEPRMRPAGAEQGVMSVLAGPFRDTNFRRLLFFLGAWNFAMNFAGPFFVVYMLGRLGMSMTWILALSVISQLVNVLFLRLWGKLADRFSNKSVLAASGPLVIVGIVLWIFTTMPERHVLTVPLLILIHALGGMSTAGVGLCAGNIALKAAPKGQATAYLATNALVSGLAATVAPILGGLAADFFAHQELSIAVRWATTQPSTRELSLPAVHLRGLDFLFLGAFLFGLYALHRLSAVREEGEVEEDIVLTELFSEVRRHARHVSGLGGVRTLTSFPYAILRRLRGRNHRGQKAGP